MCLRRCNGSASFQKISYIFKPVFINFFIILFILIAQGAYLMIFLNNEAELAFVLCHELAHYYLDHSNQAIKKHIETINSEEFKKEIARLKKLEYRVMQQLEALLKPLFLNNRRHSRENESEADKYAFTFMKNAGYDCGAIKSCLDLFDRIDDTSIYKPIDLQHTFNFNNYPFRKKWIQKESVLFGEMTGDD